MFDHVLVNYGTPMWTGLLWSLFDHDNIMLRSGHAEGCRLGPMTLESFWNLFVLDNILSQ